MANLKIYFIRWGYQRKAFECFSQGDARTNGFWSLGCDFCCVSSAGDDQHMSLMGRLPRSSKLHNMPLFSNEKKHAV